MHTDRCPEGNNSGTDNFKDPFPQIILLSNEFYCCNATQSGLISFKFQGIFLPASSIHGFAELFETQPQKYKKGL